VDLFFFSQNHLVGFHEIDVSYFGIISVNLYFGIISARVMGGIFYTWDHLNGILAWWKQAGIFLAPKLRTPSHFPAQDETRTPSPRRARSFRASDEPGASAVAPCL
jgi:hypothetical protein